MRLVEEARAGQLWRSFWVLGFRCPVFALASLGLRPSGYDPTRRRGKQVSGVRK